MRFCILTNQYSGVDTLLRFLESHGSIVLKGEVFKKISTEKNHDLLDSLFVDEKEDNAVGFVLMYNQAQDWMIEYCKGNNVKIIQYVGEEPKIAGEVDDVFLSKIRGWITQYQTSVDGVLTYDKVRITSGKYWKNTEARSRLLKFLGLRDKLLTL